MSPAAGHGAPLRDRGAAAGAAGGDCCANGVFPNVRSPELAAAPNVTDFAGGAVAPKEGTGALGLLDVSTSGTLGWAGAATFSLASTSAASAFENEKISGEPIGLQAGG